MKHKLELGKVYQIKNSNLWYKIIKRYKIVDVDTNEEKLFYEVVKSESENGEFKDRSLNYSEDMLIHMICL